MLLWRAAGTMQVTKDKAKMAQTAVPASCHPHQHGSCLAASGHKAIHSGPLPEGTIYTCPMHPEIRQPGPGACPICGMALEPELAGATSGHSPELIDMSRRFWISLVLSLPVFALEMGGDLTNLH